MDSIARDMFGVMRVLMYVMILHCSCRVRHVRCSPPGPVVECSSGLNNCKVTNGYGAFPDRTICKAAQVVYPSTEDELLGYVATAVKNKQKMKVVTKYSHSIPKLVCPGGDSGLIISTRDLNRLVSVDYSSMRMTFESGMVLKDLIESAARHGLALPHSPYWEGVTVGGMVGTGAHGSSLFGKGSAVHEYVVGMRMVVPASQEDGYVKVIHLTENDEDLNAAKVSLGLLGVISQVTFQLQPLFKRNITNLRGHDDDLENMVHKFGLKHEFGAISWYPSQREALYRADDRAPVSETGNGTNDFFGFQSFPTFILYGIRLLAEIEEETSSANGLCISSILQVNGMAEFGRGLKNDGKSFTGYPVIGFQHKMQTSGSCLDSPEDDLQTACPWDPRVKGQFFHEIGFSITLSNITDFLLDVKALREIDPKSFCGIDQYDGILIRYVKASSAYLGKEEDSVNIDITFYRSHDPNVPTLYIDVMQEIEQIGIFKYGGVPHWGKNRNVAFVNATLKQGKTKHFRTAMNKYDPDGFFSNEWTDAVLGIGNQDVMIYKDGCALEGLCLCSEDSHCAPQHGYLCTSGRVYTGARVCRKQEGEGAGEAEADGEDKAEL